MCKFLKYSLYFVLPLLITCAAIEILIRKVPNAYRYKYEWMQKNAEDVEVLVLGNSHTYFGIRPQYIDGNAFSLANVSQDQKLNLFLLEYWSDRYKNLKTVICPISVFSWFGRGIEYGSESYRCRYYKIYMDCNLYPSMILHGFEITDYETAKIKLEKYFSDNSKIDYDQYGWGNTYKLQNKDMDSWNDETEAELAVKRHSVKTWDYYERNHSIMKKLAGFCKSRGIQLVLITTPCWHSYYERIKPEQLSKMYELTNLFQKEYNLPYLNYLKDSRFCADDFFDSNHLSDVGAIKFTKILNKDIQSLQNGKH